MPVPWKSFVPDVVTMFTTAPPGLAVFRREEVRLHLELLNDVDRRRELQIGDSRILLHGRNGHTVDENVGSGVARTVGDEVRVVVAAPPPEPTTPGSEIRQHMELRARFGSGKMYRFSMTCPRFAIVVLISAAEP